MREKRKKINKRKFKKALSKWEKKIRPLIEASRSAERITAEDLAITINARAEAQP